LLPGCFPHDSESSERGVDHFLAARSVSDVPACDLAAFVRPSAAPDLPGRLPELSQSCAVGVGQFSASDERFPPCPLSWDGGRRCVLCSFAEALGVGQFSAAACRSPPPIILPSSRFLSALSGPPEIVLGVGQRLIEQAPEPLKV
jgi:hypothetical protein